MDCVIAYMTAPNKDEARQLGKALVEKKLAACVNIIDNMTSIYAWQGKLCEDAEVVFIAKTSSEKFPALVAFLHEKHSYSVPCVLQLPVGGGNPDYLAWLTSQVS